VPSIEGGDDFIWVCGPDEGLWFLVGLGDEAVDGGLEFDDRAKDASLKAAPGEFGEEALNGIEPGAGRRGEVEDDARMARQPSFDVRMRSHLPDVLIFEPNPSRGANHEDRDR